MKFSTIVEHDDSGLLMVLDALDELREDRFIEGIRSKQRSHYEIMQMTEYIKERQHRINMEANALTRFSENFIRQFATDNNRCFNTAEKLFGKIRSTIAGLKEVFRQMTPTDRKQLPMGMDNPSVFEKSPLGNNNFTPDFFGLDSFPQEIRDLYNAIETMFASSSSILALCHLMIEEEAKTRNDVVLLRQIYRDSCDELLGAVRAASVFISPEHEIPINELEERRKKVGSDDDEKFLREGYHSVNKQVMTQYLVIKTIREARNNGLTEKEAYFWRGNREKALKVRYVVEHFDEIPEVEGQQGSLNSNTLVEFLKWCEVPESQEIQLYKQYFVPNYMAKGKLKPLGWSTLSAKRKELKETFRLTDSDLAQSFSEVISPLFSPQNEDRTQDGIIEKSA